MTFELPKEYTPFWPWPQNIGTTRKILLPIIRSIYPSIIASELVGVQPMSISDYICEICRILVDGDVFSMRIRYTTEESKEEKKNHCPLCGNTALAEYNIFNADLHLNIEYYRNRTKLCKTKEQAAETVMIVVHKAYRSFMTANAEPNDVYREWLEKHVGVQKIDWDWDVSGPMFDLVEIRFANTEGATLFELTWPQ